MCATDEVQLTKVINSPASRTRARELLYSSQSGSIDKPSSSQTTCARVSARARDVRERRAELVRVRCAAVGLQNAAVGSQNAAVQFGNEAVNFAGRRSDEQVGRRSQLKWAPSRCTPERFFRCTPNRLLCVHPTASYVYTYLTPPLPHSSTPTFFLKFPTCSFRGDMVSCVPKTGRWVLSRYVHKQN